ncbi:hypothetical protein PVAND_001441 [Polypedilum vanderplanki]|uniref:Uncharacterized protein n=1 Tax=Polypedilum vanderplanki TaxID=319348 RepID=A0A9J6BNE7_POLVA|nr:hypothetical protein PVAND_001441 [Polypedilum vanderplanki]
MLLKVSSYYNDNVNYKFLYIKKDYLSLIESLRNRTFKLHNILINDEILNNSKQKKIFFIESHTNRDRKLENARQACSVESGARTNPDMDIYFIFVTNSSGIDMQYSDLIDVLMSYNNIHLRFLNPIEFSKGTILEDFFQDDKLKDSNYQIEHMSDI